ncbi:hypothetical protein ACOJIV_24090 [Haloarcula sp. AONF1]
MPRRRRAATAETTAPMTPGVATGVRASHSADQIIPWVQVVADAIVLGGSPFDQVVVGCGPVDRD